MRQLICRYFGRLDYSTDSVFEFPSGIPAFEDQTAFVLVEQPHTKPLVFMQSLNDPGLCFLTVPVAVADPEYRLNISSEDLEALDFPEGLSPQIGVELSCLVLVTVSPDADPTVNLAAPILLNIQKRKGLQAIPDLVSGFRHPLLTSEERVPC